MKPMKKLRMKLTEHEVTQKDIAPKIKRCEGYVSARMNGHKPFTAWECAVICDWLNIPKEEMAEYFPCENRTN